MVKLRCLGKSIALLFLEQAYTSCSDVRKGTIIVVPIAGRFIFYEYADCVVCRPVSNLRKSIMNIVRNKKNILLAVMLLVTATVLVGCNTGDTDGTVVSKTDTNTTTEVVEKTNTNTSVEVAVNTNEAATSEVVSAETNTTEETTSEEQSDIPEDWVKYECVEDSYSILHPTDWIAMYSNLEGGLFVDPSDKDNTTQLYIELKSENIENLSLIDWYNSSLNQPAIGHVRAPIEQVTLNGVQALLIENIRTSTYYIKIDSRIFLLQSNSWDEDAINSMMLSIKNNISG